MIELTKHAGNHKDLISENVQKWMWLIELRKGIKSDNDKYKDIIDKVMGK